MKNFINNVMNDTSSSSFKLLLLIGMVIQNSSVVLIGRYSRASISNKEDLYVVNDLILMTEMMKFILASILEYNATHGALMKSLKENVWDVPLDAAKILVPSLLYLMQNSLLYIALSNLSAPMFQVTYQSKLLTTAVVSVFLLARKYSVKQWVCLTLLGIGVAIVVIGETDGEKEEDTNTDLAKGLIAVTIACFSSAFAGVYFEMVLKKPTVEKGEKKKPVSLWMRNIQMAFFSIWIALINGWRMTGEEADKPFLHGFTGWVWSITLLQAGGGLLVAAVIKYADNVLKGLATGVSVVTSTACSMILFGTPLHGQFLCGALVILGSVFFFSNDLPPACGGAKAKTENDVVPEKPTPEDVEMQKPLVTK